ncbi:hypothetical protein BMS3Abin05_01407 [bacterium BMS3Abin05]|nr:hypothetical protein BMS3Abin05_01407 [bacterium BMS3Abin05]
MRVKKWPAVFGFILMTFGAASAADISGNLSGRLEISGSPYRIIDDTFVQQSDTLRIDPGVILEFAGEFRLNVYGKLFAEGTAEDSIVFCSDTSNPAPGDWDGIYLDHAVPGSRFKYVKVMYAATGIMFDGSEGRVDRSLFKHNINGMDVKNSARPVILQSYFLWNTNAAIRVLYSTPQIRANYIYHNSENGPETAAVVFGNAAGGTFVGNRVAQNGKAGIDCNLSAKPLISNNTFVDNLYGITVATGASPKIENNIVLRNGLGIAVDDGNPVVKYNYLWASTTNNFYNCPDSVGKMIGIDANGDSLDAFYNRVADPKLVSSATLNFAPQSDSPVIDMGDPANPGGIVLFGTAPDVGAIEWSPTMPVELSAFYWRDGYLFWKTASETNNYGFEIYRSEDENWKSAARIGFVKGSGNSVEAHFYRFRDPQAGFLSGRNYYRLKQIDLDGTSHWGEKTVLVSFDEKNSLRISSNYPNPFNGETSFVLYLPVEKTVSVGVFNPLGQRISTILTGERLQPGAHTLVWKGVNAQGTAVGSGQYFIVIRVGNKRFVRRVIYLK